MKYLRRNNLEKALKQKNKKFRIKLCNLEYTTEEIANFNLTFPYQLKGKEKDDWTHHAHTWHELVQDILEDYEIFSIEGFEEYYSKQEQKFIDKLLLGLKKLDDEELRDYLTWAD